MFLRLPWIVNNFIVRLLIYLPAVSLHRINTEQMCVFFTLSVYRLNKTLVRSKEF
jgi:hypothetical protein